MYYFFSFLLFVNLCFSAQESIDEKYIYKLVKDTRNVDTINGGPLASNINLAENEYATIYSPQIDLETLEIKPRPKLITQAIQHPEVAFNGDVRKYAQEFKKFSQSYHSCTSDKKWPESANCFSQVKICFDDFRKSSFCGWDSHFTISRCARRHHGSTGLLDCAKKKQEHFNLLSRCFHPEASLAFMFEIYGSEAKRRDYFTLDTYSSNSSSEMSCRFEYFNGAFNLIQISDTWLGRPGASMVPMDVFVRDNYYELLKRQNDDKAKAQNIKLKE